MPDRSRAPRRRGCSDPPRGELSPHEFRATGWEGVATAAWRTPSGRVLLSDGDRAFLERWYAEHGQDRAIVSPADSVTDAGFSVLPTPPPDKAVITDFDSLLEEIGRIRTRGYALLDEELEGVVVGASAPVFDLNGRIIAAIHVSAPQLRMGDRLPTLGRYVAEAAASLSERLGAS